VPCGTGEASAELAALGAFLTGVDPSEAALAAARELAPNAVFLRAAPDSLPAELQRGRFELVFADRVSGLEVFLPQAATALRDGGDLIVRETHPVALALDQALRWRGDYLEEGATIGALLTLVAGAGFTIRRVAELRSEERPRRIDPRVPAEIVIVATRASPPSSRRRAAARRPA
jgi:SAM-dependent methyltransferase